MSPDGAHIAAWDADGKATVLDAATGAEVHSFRMAAAGTRGRWPTARTDNSWRVQVRDSTHIDIWERKRCARWPG